MGIVNAQVGIRIRVVGVTGLLKSQHYFVIPILPHIDL